MILVVSLEVTWFYRLINASNTWSKAGPVKDHLVMGRTRVATGAMPTIMVPGITTGKAIRTKVVLVGL